MFTNEGKTPTTPQKQSYWKSFLERPELKSQEEFVLKVWQGVPTEQRLPVWRICINSYLTGKNNDIKYKDNVMGQLSTDLQEDIVMESTAGHFEWFDPPIEETELNAIGRILACYLHTQQLNSYIEGSAQLVARLYMFCKKSEVDAYQIYTFLMDMMQDYLRDDCLKLRNEVLVLADLIVLELPDLAKHFNDHKFDVVDLCDIALVWVPPLFSCHFNSEAVGQILDILIIQGSKEREKRAGSKVMSSLLGFIFGLFKIFKDTLLRKHSNTLFKTISNLPSSLNNEQINEAFQIGYQIYENNVKITIEEIRNKKHWYQFLSSYSGPIEFVKDVGIPQKQKKKYTS